MYRPSCLAEGEVRYYLKAWRIAMNTVRLHHRHELPDRCPNCQAGVGFTRADLRRSGVKEFPDLSLCHACGFDLCEAEAAAVICLE